MSAANAGAGAMALIEVRDVTKIYKTGDLDVPVLKGVTCSVARGEMVALMGASGSGKTTLMNILGCLDRPTSGEYLLDGEEASRLSNDARALLRNAKIGFVFQSFNLLARTSALDNVLMPLTYAAHELPETEATARAKRLLERVGLGDRLDHVPSRLSGGQQQRVAIARALVNEPPLLLADEPTGNLDSKTSAEVLQMFQQLNEEDGITIVLVTHDAEVARHARRTIRIKDGVVDSGAAALAAAAAADAAADAADRRSVT
jgi:ABC-type lipoprotein export system ATPase subunit